MGSTPIRLPQTHNTPTTNIHLYSAPIMSPNLFTNPANSSNSIPGSFSDPLIGLTQDEAITRNIVNEYNDRSQVLTSTVDPILPQNAQVRNPQPQTAAIGNAQPQYILVGNVNLQPSAFVRITNTQSQP